jgi:hypothetical protein
MIIIKINMRSLLVLALFLIFSFAQAITIKRSDVTSNFLDLDAVEKQVDMVVMTAQQLQTSSMVNPVKIIAAYLELEDAITKSTKLCNSRPDPFTARQSEILIARTAEISKKLEGALVICEQLGAKIGLFSPRIVYRVLLSSMKVLLKNAAKCYGSHVPPAENAKIQALLEAAIQLLDKSIAKVK